MSKKVLEQIAELKAGAEKMLQKAKELADEAGLEFSWEFQSEVWDPSDDWDDSGCTIGMDDEDDRNSWDDSGCTIGD